jgi:hypothetical protein
MARKYIEKAKDDIGCAAGLNVNEPQGITWEEWTEEAFEVFELPAEAGLFLYSEYHRIKSLKS